MNEKMNGLDLNMSLEDLDFSVTTWKRLKNAGVRTLEDLSVKTVDDLLDIQGLGRKSLEEIAGKFAELGLELVGYTGDASKYEYVDEPVARKLTGRVSKDGYWSEIRNTHFCSLNEIQQDVEGDVLGTIAIDAWKTMDDMEAGTVIACVMLSKHGDVLVDYRDNVARYDAAAQEAIQEAKDELRDYFMELDLDREELNEMKDEEILYFGEGHFVTREALQEMVVAAAEDFVSKVNKPNGKRDSKHSFTYDFGSPWDELDMYAEYSQETRSWWTVCSLYTKGENPDLTGVLSVETTTDVNDIAENILELVEELSAKIEIEYVSAMREAMAEAKPLEAVLSDANERGAVDRAAGQVEMEM